MSSGKRAMDLVLGGALLLVSLPLSGVIAVLVKISSPGPIVFRQQRIGQGRRTFELLKFRSMRQTSSPAGPRVTRAGDPRVTPLGKWLRRHKLDELPQLFNVLRGEMSLVGPRPEVVQYLPDLNVLPVPVLSLRPGLTGAASIKFRDEESVLAQVPLERLDEHYRVMLRVKAHADWSYAQRASFARDLQLLWRTVMAL
jgi:lipopolysaccharide/colanic/teichoic acid biosynthesis glycosyltransferase